MNKFGFAQKWFLRDRKNPERIFATVYRQKDGSYTAAPWGGSLGWFSTKSSAVNYVLTDDNLPHSELVRVK